MYLIGIIYLLLAIVSIEINVFCDLAGGWHLLKKEKVKIKLNKWYFVI